MSHTMIGNATIVAQHAVIHHPGFKVKAGLYYHAYIDTNFTGTGTSYTPPPDPGPIAISPSDKNYVIEYTPQDTNFNPSSAHTCDQVTIDIRYFDGLGRELQDVSVMGSPDQKDIIKPHTYDECGRADKDYIPYDTLSQQNGGFDDNYAVNQVDFIKNQFGDINKDYGFSRTVYEPSPLNRVIKQSAPGAAWSFNTNPDLERVTEFDYLQNTTSIQSWKNVNNTFTQITYNPGTLYVTVTKNENKNSNRSVTMEYKDKAGKTVIRESYLNSTALRTIYVYDDLDLLRCVIPPLASSPSDQNLCYFYNFDSRKRLKEKKLPDKGWEYFVYDKRDRLVLQQDANLRSESPNSCKWFMNSYDVFNRLVMSGVYEHSSALNQKDMQSLYDSVVTNLNENINGNFNNTDHGYTRNVVANLRNNSSYYDVRTVKYYSKYDFVTGYGFDNSNGIVNESKKLSNPINMVTGTKTKVLSPEQTMIDWITSAIYYDNKYHVIQTVSDNGFVNGRDIITTRFSFTGRSLAMKTKHIAFSDTIIFTENFKYDHRGRMQEHLIEGIPTQPPVILASMHYNKLGQLMNKLSHSESGNDSYSPFIQKTDYCYNIRGWLIGINDPDNTAKENDIFAMNLYYNDILSNLSNRSQFNGNISAVKWKTNKNSDLFAYRYNYDSLNRITQGNFYKNWTHDGSFDEKNITYDVNGNIQTLDRYASSNQKIDQLTYHYLSQSNQPSYIQDEMGDIPAVVNYPGLPSTNTQGYYYDGNGNMIQDFDKGINTPIVYSDLNKPELLDFGNGEKIQYIYEAEGNKLAKKVMNGNIIQATSLFYCGPFIYDWDGDLQYILTSEGRIIHIYNDYIFEYYSKDHLGNNRATFAPAAPGVAQVSEYQHYYPFGMQLESLCYTSGADIQSNNLYNGKELQTEYRLQWYDYGARFYDPQLGRFHTVDAFAEKYSILSPYQYGANNPVCNIDINGDSTWVTTTDKAITIHTSIEFSGNAIYKKDGSLRKSAQSKIDAIKNDISSRWNGIELDGKEVEVDLVTTTSSTGNTEKSYDQIELKNGSGETKTTISDQEGNTVPPSQGIQFMKDLANGTAKDYNVSGVFYLNTPSGTFAHEYGHMAGYFREEYQQNSDGSPKLSNTGFRSPIERRYKSSIMFSPVGNTRPLEQHIRTIMSVNKTDGK